VRKHVADGAVHNGEYWYENMDYGLCRILIATVHGPIPVDFELTGSLANLTDQVWDSITITTYVNWVTSNGSRRLPRAAPARPRPELAPQQHRPEHLRAPAGRSAVEGALCAPGRRSGRPRRVTGARRGRAPPQPAGRNLPTYC
jgi:hypothetical protein